MMTVDLGQKEICEVLYYLGQQLYDIAVDSKNSDIYIMYSYTMYIQAVRHTDQECIYLMVQNTCSNVPTARA